VQYSTCVMGRIWLARSQQAAGLFCTVSTEGGRHRLQQCQLWVLARWQTSLSALLPICAHCSHVSYRSIARFGQSLTRSFGRSVGSPVGAKSPAPGGYMDAAAAAAATDTHTGTRSQALYPLYIRLSVYIIAAALPRCQLSASMHCVEGKWGRVSF
jgi:hypothetical protein